MKKGDMQNYLKNVKPDIVAFNELKIDETMFSKEVDLN